MRSKITALWKKLTTAILALLGIGTLTACYGCPPPSLYVYGRVTTPNVADNGEGKAINGIHITCRDSNEVLFQTTTDSNGNYFCPLSADPSRPVSVSFEDTDGFLNGGIYQSQILSGIDADDREVEQNISLESL